MSGVHHPPFPHLNRSVRGFDERFEHRAQRIPKAVSSAQHFGVGHLSDPGSTLGRRSQAPRGAYTTINHIRSPTQGWEMAFGDVYAAADRVKNDRQFSWFLEATISMGRKTRARVFGLTLYTPYSKPVSPEALRDLNQHLDDMHERSSYKETCVARLRSYFCEEECASEIRAYSLAEGPLADQAEQALMERSTPRDRLIPTILSLLAGHGACLPRIDGSFFSPGYGPVPGDPLIRIGWESYYGITCHRSDLMDRKRSALVWGFLADVESLTSGPGRDRIYDPVRKGFRRRTLADDLDFSEIPPHLRLLMAAQENLVSPNAD